MALERPVAQFEVEDRSVDPPCKCRCSQLIGCVCVALPISSGDSRGSMLWQTLSLSSNHVASSASFYAHPRQTIKIGRDPKNK
jgi:hypothetical protein